MKKLVLVAGVMIATVMLGGCAAKVDPALKAEAMKPLTCNDEKQCDFYWKRAQFWLANNSSWKIQTATDTLISTYNPSPNSPFLAYQVSKMPMKMDPQEFSSSLFAIICLAVNQTPIRQLFPLKTSLKQGSSV